MMSLPRLTVLQKLRSPRFRRRTLVPYLVLAGTLAVTAISAMYVESTARAKDWLQFDGAVQRAHSDLRERFQTAIALLQGTSGLFTASGTVTRDEFRNYVGHLSLQEQHPGIQGIGFSVRVFPPEKDALIAEMRRQGLTNFQIRPDYPRDRYHTIIYIEPLNPRNRAAIGFDMFTESVRRAAMERARDTGNPAASGRVILVQEIEQQKQPGFLIYVPVYEGSSIPNTLAERRAQLRGFVYSPFRVGDFVDSIFGEQVDPGVDFQIYDGAVISPQNLLYQSQPSHLENYTPLFTSTTALDVAGHPWTIVFTSRPDLEQSSERRFASLIAMGGICISFILFAVTRSQVQARNTAEHIASELQQSEKALAESEKRFRTVIEQSPMSIQILSPDGKTIRVNRAWEQLWGIELDELKDYNMLSDQQLVEKGIMSYIEQGFSGEIAMVPAAQYDPKQLFPDAKREDSLRWVQAFIYPVKDEGGHIREVVLMHEDITERKQLEAQLQTRAEQLTEANRLKDEFLATLSHELRTPLNAMLGWSQLLAARQLDEKMSVRAIDSIHRNTRSLAQLIEDLLDVSRIITGKLHIDLKSIHLIPVIEAAIDTIHPTAIAKNIAIETTFDAKNDLILGDAHRLQQVIWNLLSNAVKFTPDRGQIHVQVSQIQRDQKQSSEEAASLLQIQVRDTGRGISPEFLPHVFERFRQADGTTTRSQGGLGLGLAIVRHLVELHGGTVEATSPGLGQGTTFTVKLPLLHELMHSNHDGETDSTDAFPQLKGTHVLIVEDEKDTRELLNLVLSRYQLHTKAAASVSEALDVFQAFQPQIVISDIGMPHQDGYDLIHEIRTLPADRGGTVPAIALTAYAKEQDREKAIAAGFQKHLPKPVEPEILMEAIAELVQS